MVDPLGTERVEGPDDRRRWSLLARVGHDVEPEPPAAGEHAAKLLRRVAALTRIKPHSEERIAKRLRLLERLEGFALGEMPQKAHDECGRDAQLPPCPFEGPAKPLHDRLESHPAGRVRLGIEKDLRPHHVVGMGLLEIGPGHLKEVLFCAEDRGGRIVDVEEALQVAESVCLSHRPGRLVRQGDAVPPADGEGQFRLERALDVDMEFGLGCSLDPADEFDW